MRIIQTYLIAALVSLAIAQFACALAAEQKRSAPRPLESHPGNIFLVGQNVIVQAPPGEGDAWRAIDYEEKVVANGRVQDGRVEIGPLPVGWYKIVRGGEGHVTNRVFFGVLEPLRTPTPASSPIGIDVAMAWFFPNEEKMRQVASLCQLAGVNWVRDRLLWGEIEPNRGQFVASTRYDSSARIQSQAGLQILQVCHVSPPWANSNPKRFPSDLRDAYNFWRAAAQRWTGQVSAFEPWNEADISVFGGHTGSEMASFQKASYLGLKAGNPKVVGCLNVFAIRRATTLKDFEANEAWPYFDTYNLHHYEPLENYPALYADHRAVSGGRPMWVTECSVRVKWKGDEQLRELSNEDLRLQSERVTKTYAKAIHEGAKNVFYFVLPHYSEGQLQFGVVRADLTPRPAFLAVAAAGRLLAEARPLGRLEATNNGLEGFVFAAKPDGKPADVLVIWAEKETTFELRKPAKACFDHLGRKREIKGSTLNVGRAPLYLILPRNSRPALAAPPSPAKLLPGKPGSLVLQALLPEEETVLDKSAYKIQPDQTKVVPIFLYNFGSGASRGRLKVAAPDGWEANFPNEAEVAPGERKQLALQLHSPATTNWTDAEIRISGDFGKAGQPVLSFRFTPAPDQKKEKP